MWFALDVEPKYFAKSKGLPPFVFLLAFQNYSFQPFRAMNGRREISGRGERWEESSHFLILSPGRTLERRLRMKDVSVTKELLSAFEERLAERLGAAESTRYANRQITVFVLK